MPLSPAAAAAVRRKVAWHILPLAILLYFVAYLDRANVGFAKLRMAQDLGLSEEVFGLGIGIFFLGYLTLEIPGALLVAGNAQARAAVRVIAVDDDGQVHFEILPGPISRHLPFVDSATP